MEIKEIWCTTTFFFLFVNQYACGFDPRSFDDSILYKIDFQLPNFEENPVINLSTKIVELKTQYKFR